MQAAGSHKYTICQKHLNKMAAATALPQFSFIVVAQLEEERSLRKIQREKESNEVQQATEEHQRVLRGHLEKKVLSTLSTP